MLLRPAPTLPPQNEEETAVTATTMIQPRVDKEVRDRIADRIARLRNVTEAEAKGNFDKMVEWLAWAAVTPGAHSPTETVDIAWHEFILDTRRYALFCQDNFGRFIHHQPLDGGGGMLVGECSVTNCVNA